MNRKNLITATVYVFAVIGAFFTISYILIICGFTKTPGIKDLNRVMGGEDTNYISASSTKDNFYEQAMKNKDDVLSDWNTTDEYLSFKKSVVKDSYTIKKAGNDADINPRLIVSALLVEQLRLYTDSGREVFKKVFEPLSILGIQSQYSWGVMGLKQETAIQIEENLKNRNSPYYLGTEFENILDFQTDDHDTERFDRIIEEDNQYYSYLYTGIYMKQTLKQWSDAGFPINNRPDIIATLYNIGFSNSKPNANPASGGAAIKVGGKTYSFGNLASQFYYSNELLEEFPRN